MGHRIQRVKTPVSEPQMAQAIIAGWRDLFDNTPSKDQVAMILAQNSLETGHRNAMWNYNVGNITTDGKGVYNFFDDLTTNEQTSPGSWNKMNLKYRAYPDLQSGVKDYLQFLSHGRFASAFSHILNPDPVAFSKALKAGGYYTANEADYTNGIKNLFNQSDKSNSYELAMSGKINAPRRPIHQSMFGQLEGLLDKYVSELFASDLSLKRLYKKALPNHQILIQVNAPTYNDAIEFSRVLCSALDQELLSTSHPHSDGSSQVEVECQISGDSSQCLSSVQQLSQAVAEVFQEATQKIGGIPVKTACQINCRSNFYPLSSQSAASHYRQFQLRFA